MESLTPYIILMLTAIGGVIWWSYRRTQSDLRHHAEAMAKMREVWAREFADYRLHVAESYVTNNELGKAIETLNRSIDAVFQMLHRIDGKIDQKADK